MNRYSLGTLAALTALLLLPVVVQAQAYKWRDEKGSIVYSDKPPPSNIAPGNILQSPKLRQSTPDSVSAKGDSAKGAAPKAAVPLTLAEREAEFKKRQAESAKKADEESKKAADDATRLSNCQQLRGQLASIDSGQRQKSINQKGEAFFLDDAQLAAEKTKVSKQLMENKCP